MSDVPESDWQQPNMPPRPDPIQPTPRSMRHAEMVALRDYMEMKIADVDERGIMRIEALAKELAVALRANEIAIDKAERATEKRFESVNEFRQTLSDQTRTFVDRNTFDSMERNLIEKIDSMQKWQANELAALRSTMESKIDAQYKIIFTMAGAIAAIQATLAFLA